jgi:transcriptional regulator with XRE-family HTH domain
MKQVLTNNNLWGRIMSMEKLFDITRRAIVDATVSRHAISKATGVDRAALSRFVHNQRGLSVQSLEAILDYLGYTVEVTQTESEAE